MDREYNFDSLKHKCMQRDNQKVPCPYKTSLSEEATDNLLECDEEFSSFHCYSDRNPGERFCDYKPGLENSQEVKCTSTSSISEVKESASPPLLKGYLEKIKLGPEKVCSKDLCAWRVCRSGHIQDLDSQMLEYHSENDIFSESTRKLITKRNRLNMQGEHAVPSRTRALSPRLKSYSPRPDRNLNQNAQSPRTMTTSNQCKRSSKWCSQSCISPISYQFAHDSSHMLKYRNQYTDKKIEEWKILSRSCPPSPQPKQVPHVPCKLSPQAASNSECRRKVYIVDESPVNKDSSQDQLLSEQMSVIRLKSQSASPTASFSTSLQAPTSYKSSFRQIPVKEMHLISSNEGKRCRVLKQLQTPLCAHLAEKHRRSEANAMLNNTIKDRLFSSSYHKSPAVRVPLSIRRLLQDPVTASKAFVKEKPKSSTKFETIGNPPDIKDRTPRSSLITNSDYVLDKKKESHSPKYSARNEDDNGLKIAKMKLMFLSNK